jgi:3-dehydroquinate dehydratase
MNTRLDDTCTRFKEEINTIELCLGQVGKHLASAADTGVDALEVELDKATEKREAKREQAAHAGHRIKQLLEESKENVVTKFEDWKTDREIEKIEKDADKKEQQAVDAIVVAAYALLEAEVAIVDALKARKMAIEVAG